MGQAPKNINLDFKTSEFSINMSVNFDGKEEPEKEDRASKLGEILEKFSSLSPENQNLILEFADFIEKKIEETNGQDPNT